MSLSSRRLLIVGGTACFIIVAVVGIVINSTHKNAVNTQLTTSHQSEQSAQDKQPQVSGSNSNLGNTTQVKTPAPANNLSYSDKLPYSSAVSALNNAAEEVQTSLTSTDPLGAQDDLQNASFEISQIPAVFESLSYSATVQTNVTQLKYSISNTYSSLEQALTDSEGYNTANAEATSSLDGGNDSNYTTLSGQAGNYRSQFYINIDQAQSSLSNAQETLNKV